MEMIFEDKVDARIVERGKWFYKDCYIKINPKFNKITFVDKKTHQIETEININGVCKFSNNEGKILTYRNSGYIYALLLMMNGKNKRGIPHTKWKKSSNLCKTRGIIKYLDFSRIGETNQEYMDIAIQCKTFKNGRWRLVTRTKSYFDIYTISQRNVLIRTLFLQGVPVITLSELFKLSKRQVRTIVEKNREGYKMKQEINKCILNRR